MDFKICPFILFALLILQGYWRTPFSLPFFSHFSPLFSTRLYPSFSHFLPLAMPHHDNIMNISLTPSSAFLQRPSKRLNARFALTWDRSCINLSLLQLKNVCYHFQRGQHNLLDQDKHIKFGHLLAPSFLTLSKVTPLNELICILLWRWLMMSRGRVYEVGCNYKRTQLNVA